eukprot:9106213-Lingulodinium_polyedra.AAC.1
MPSNEAISSGVTSPIPRGGACRGQHAAERSRVGGQGRGAEPSTRQADGWRVAARVIASASTAVRAQQAGSRHSGREQLRGLAGPGAEHALVDHDHRPPGALLEIQHGLRREERG